jgi:hypothetical protein
MRDTTMYRSYAKYMIHHSHDSHGTYRGKQPRSRETALVNKSYGSSRNYNSYSSHRSQQIVIRLDSRLRGNDGGVAALDAESAEILAGIREMV